MSPRRGPLVYAFDLIDCLTFDTFLIFWGSQKAPPLGVAPDPPSEKKGLPLEAFDIFFGNLQLGRSQGEEGLGPPKITLENNFGIFWQFFNDILYF